MSQVWSHLLPSLRHNSFQTKERLVRMVDQTSDKFERYKKIIKYTSFIQIEKFVHRSSLCDI